MRLKRMVVGVEFLYDADVVDPEDQDFTLIDLLHESEDGSMSANWHVVKCEDVSPARMARLLVKQGSDPSFLLGDEGEEQDEA